MADEAWIKSTFSFSNGNCLEVRVLADDQVAIRNSRFPDVLLPAFTRAEWEAFVAGVRAGDFDHIAAGQPG